MTESNIQQNIEGFIQRYYLLKVVEGLNSIDVSVLEAISDKVAQRVREGRRIFAFGNGGSEAIAEAFVYTLEQRIGDNFKFDVYGNPRLSEATDAGINTLFNFRIRRSGRPGDLAVLVSASGNSTNINNVAGLCREQSIETISLSGNGLIATARRSDYPIIFQINDQQILEDVTLGLLYIVGEIVEQKVNGKKYNAAEIKGKYVAGFVDGTAKTDYSTFVLALAQDILQAYKKGSQIRVDAPDNGLLSINAGHMQHNLKWDAFQDVEPRLTNRVTSGFPTYHLSGVSNDGGEGFNYAVEVQDNNQPDDVEIVFAKDLSSKPVQALLLAAKRKGIRIHSFEFNGQDDYVASNICQSFLHITSRVINAYLLSEKTGYADFEHRLRQDLAMLRKKDETLEKLTRVYK